MVGDATAEAWPGVVLPSDDLPTVLLLRDSTMYTTAMYLERALARICNVKPFYVNQFPDIQKALALTPNVVRTRLLRRLLFRSLRFDRGFRAADLVLLVEPATLGFVPSGFGSVTAYYAIDSHRNFQRHIRQDRAPAFDVTFAAQKDFVPKYEEAGCRRVHWLPLAHDPEIHRLLGLPRRRTVVFVGNPWPGTERGEAIDRMQSAVGMEVSRAYQHDMVRIYNEAKVVFNRSLGGDLDMRVFEALGCGSFLLTDRCGNGFEELFRPGEDLAAYGSIEEAVELARHYLHADEQRETIAARGHAAAIARHTYDVRARDILKHTLGFNAPRPP